MPPRPEDEARLEQSKMSFGEHLEELRRALFKSIAALFIGFLIGLVVASHIIAYVQTPVKQALASFYMRQAQQQQEAHLQELAAGSGLSADQQIVTAEEMEKSGLLVSEYLIAPNDLRRLIERQFPELAKSAPAAAPPAEQDAKANEEAKGDGPQQLRREELVPLRLFQPVEQDSRLRVVGHSTMEPFSMDLKVALIAGAVFAGPFIFYFIWEFVAAGLYRHEQKYIYTYLPISIGLFVGGALLAFFFAFKPLLDFMFWYYERTNTQPDLRLSEWISFVMMMPLGFGVSFQLPLVMLLLERIGIFTVESYWSKWRVAILVIAVAAMLITPSTDPYSMVLLMLPLIALYFGGIWLCRLAPGRRLDSPGELLARRT